MSFLVSMMIAKAFEKEVARQTTLIFVNKLPQSIII